MLSLWALSFVVFIVLHFQTGNKLARTRSDVVARPEPSVCEGVGKFAFAWGILLALDMCTLRMIAT